MLYGINNGSLLDQLLFAIISTVDIVVKQKSIWQKESLHDFATKEG